jgi:hypothetical protein
MREAAIVDRVGKFIAACRMLLVAARCERESVTSDDGGAGRLPKLDGRLTGPLLVALDLDGPSRVSTPREGEETAREPAVGVGREFSSRKQTVAKCRGDGSARAIEATRQIDSAASITEFGIAGVLEQSPLRLLEIMRQPANFGSEGMARATDLPERPPSQEDA